VVIDLNGAVSDDQRAPQRKGGLQLMLGRFSVIDKFSTSQDLPGEKLQGERMAYRRRLLRLGMALLLLLTGLAQQHFMNIRMALAAHLEGVMNGTFLIAVGAICPCYG
jgi:hypothetical protein